MYDVKPLTQSKRNKCLEILSTIVAKNQGDGNKRAEDRIKKDFINSLKNRRK